MLRWLLLPACLGLSLSSQAVPKKLVNVVWDGAADWVIDRLLAEGKLPNLAKLKARGVSAERMIAGWPSKTAVGHAAIFTGAWADVNGIANNSVPLLPCQDHTLDESMRGFDATALLAEPVWVTAANAGRKAVALSAACSYPPEAFARQIRDTKKFVEFSGFETSLQSGRMLRNLNPFTVAGTEFTLEAIDDPADPAIGKDTLTVRGGGKTIQLKPRPAPSGLGEWSRPILVSKDDAPGMVAFRLYSMDSNGSSVELYQRAVGGMRGTEPLAERSRYIEAYGGFHDDPFSAYERGVFGKPIFEGGSGQAEERVLELVQLDCSYLKNSFDYGWSTYKPDLLFHYTPMSDSAGHTWMGALDPSCPGYDPLMAARLWPYYERVYQLQDDWLGHIVSKVGDKAIVALMSDHGMAGVRWYFHVNTVLERAGLLVRDAKGKIDWSKTKIAVPDWTDFFLVVNGSERKGGIVAAWDKDMVVEQARQALMAATDPATGRPYVTATFTPVQFPSLGIGGPRGGDLYFELAPGFYPSNRASKELIAKNGDRIGSGVHGFFPQRQTMGAIFYAAGPGLSEGVSLPVIRQIDVMPTLCAAIGIPAPKNSTGVGVFAALGK